MKNLIYRQGNYGSICFPYGKLKDGGSCQFATAKCLKNCSEQFNRQEWFRITYKYFKDNDSLAIYRQLVRELKEKKFKLLQWFDSGDCPTNLTHKIFGIMSELSKDGYVQCGFTRNKPLWEKANTLSRMRMGFTVENESDIKKNGLYGIPNYKTYYTQIVIRRDEKEKVDTREEG